MLLRASEMRALAPAMAQCPEAVRVRSPVRAARTWALIREKTRRPHRASRRRATAAFRQLALAAVLAQRRLRDVG